MTRPFFSDLASRYALAFGGQGAYWQPALRNALLDPQTGPELRACYQRAWQILTPVRPDLVLSVPGAYEELDRVMKGEADAALNLPTEAAISLPAIVLTQIAQLINLEHTDLDLAANPPTAYLGHSQGILAAELARRMYQPRGVDSEDQSQHTLAAQCSDAKCEQGTPQGANTRTQSHSLSGANCENPDYRCELRASILAAALAIGYAASAGTAQYNWSQPEGSSPMLSVRGAITQLPISIPAEVYPAVTNGPHSQVWAGSPHELTRFRADLEQAAAQYNADLAARKFGGSPAHLQCDFLSISAPFHTELLAPALRLLTEWADRVCAASADTTNNADKADKAGFGDGSAEAGSAGSNTGSSGFGDADNAGSAEDTANAGNTCHLGNTGNGNNADSLNSADFTHDSTATENGTAAGNFGVLEPATVRKLAEEILVCPAQWPEHITRAQEAGVLWFIDLGPSDALTRMSAPLVQGSGTGFIDASTAAAMQDLDTAGVEIPEPRSYTEYLPRLVTLPDGRTVLDTAFTRLTGRSPIMLPGMTPTTVSPEIVAAAANAGLWAEMAGGGQYSEEVFTDNKNGLSALLDAGRTAGFNTMFFDRFMWNLQFGVNRIVAKARQNGAPFDAVTIAAGIPEPDEARELLTSLHADGFRHISFKPGTTEQIHAVLNIARSNPEHDIIMQIEDGHAGGHHSWENLDDLLLATYDDIRATKNVVLAVGGGIGTPQRASDYLTGRWAYAYNKPALPVDAVFVGTAAMAVKEARTSPQVKELLRDTPGITEGWIAQGEVAGGITSGLSHLSADMYEIDNASARASRLLHEINGDPEALTERREDIIAALAQTAKPYFGDVAEMTYAQWIERAIELSYPYADWTWQDRIFDLFHRIEARLNPTDHGQIPTLFPTSEDIADAPAALALLLERYPEARTQIVHATDAAWFVELCRKHHKPMPFVPVLDGDLARWWGTDTLWQSQDPRFSADAVRIIPGPISVAGIDRIDEPIGQMFARYEQAVVADVQCAEGAPAVFSRLANAADAEEYLRNTPFLSWNGNLMPNPLVSQADSTEICTDESGMTIRVTCDTYWDDLTTEATSDSQPYAVRAIDIPILLPESCHTGGYPVVDMERLSVSAFDLLAGAAGVGSVSATTADAITELPAVQITDGDNAPFGRVHTTFTFARDLGPIHRRATGEALHRTPSTQRPEQLASFVPDALVGPCWPAIYAALGSARYQGYPVIEGLINAVHLDHTVRIVGQLPPAEANIDVEAWCAQLSESSSGRVVRVELLLRHDGKVWAELTERFAIRGRVTSAQPPAAAPALSSGEAMIDTPRSFIRRWRVGAPADMTAFANISGDFNPIHTSYAAAQLAGLEAPLVHGMWLSATAQHAMSAQLIPDPTLSANATTGYRIERWSYQMFGMVNLRDTVDITVERIGRIAGGSLVFEATCRIADEIVAIGRAHVAPLRTAYLYPGQGIQRAMMGLESPSPVAREIWRRADQHTRTQLGFSIEAIVRENPTQITVNGEVLRHPDGVLNLTQFTQTALATLAYAQTEDLRSRGLLARDAFLAGHSLGEYNALSAYAQIFPLEKVLEIVYQRGSAMHHLVPRDADGRSNYLLGALRPNQFGVSHDEVDEYVAGIARTTGEFLEIVNYNLAGSQYAVAGTVAGIRALEADAGRRAEEAGGKRPFMLIPGIDVPFHSSALRSGVDAFRHTLDNLLPENVDYRPLLGRYLPNLVARPFELTQEFAQSILDVVPSRLVADLVAQWDQAIAQPQATARTLLLELLAWQFASPVRWIETQNYLFRDADADPAGAGVQQAIEIGLGSAPTLANLAAKTLAADETAGQHVVIWNVERDAARVTYTDSQAAPEVLDAASDNPADRGNTENEARLSAASPAAVTENAEVNAETHASSAAPETAQSGAALPNSAGVLTSDSSAAIAASDAPELPLRASHAVEILLAYANRITREQISAEDTVESLTNGVSSKRNQILMDMAAELGVPSIDGAAEATIRTLAPHVDSVAGTYRTLGPVLREAVTARLRKLLGSVGVKPSHISDRITSTWGLPASWVDHVHAEILLGSRDGDSVRGGALATLPLSVSSAADLDGLIDSAISLVAARHNVHVAPPHSGAGNTNQVIDSAALDDLRRQLFAEDGILAGHARDLLARLGMTPKAAQAVAYLHDQQESLGALAELNTAIDAELGPRWLESITPRFVREQTVLLDDRWASLREDLAQIYAGTRPCDVPQEHFRGSGHAVAELARWYARQDASPHAEYFLAVAEQAERPADERESADIALVTGAAPNSIAEAVVARLLGQGATVIMTASQITPARLAWAKRLYRQHASVSAALWLVPANLSSFRDVDALIEWIGTPYTQAVGATTKVLKPALLPTVFFPFAAPRVQGMMGDNPSEASGQMRLLLWSVERAIAQLAQLGRTTAISHRVHVILPGSPNRGTFGGDGAYGEAKAAFDAIMNKWSAERSWPDRISLVRAQIGWVRGTGLMGGNDVLVPAAQAAGVHVYSTDEIAEELIALTDAEHQAAASRQPLDVDLTGGLASARLNLAELAAHERASQQAQQAGQAGQSQQTQQHFGQHSAEYAGGQFGQVSDTGNAGRQLSSANGQLSTTTAQNSGAHLGISAVPQPAQIAALPTLLPATIAPQMPWPSVTARLDETIVIVGIGEVSAWGSGRTRFAAEFSENFDLTAAGVLELAWMMDLLTWNDSPVAGWYDREGNRVAEEDIYKRFRDEVIARCGIRELTDTEHIIESGSNDVITVYLESDQEFSVSDEAEAERYRLADPDFTEIFPLDERDLNSEWIVRKRAGAPVRVPRRAALSRHVAGQLPEGFDPRKWGIPAAMVDSLDPVAVWNLVTAVDAFTHAGFSPIELLQAVHPAEVSSTQGTGIGGMNSLRKVFLDRFLGEDRPQDILQEALPNVVAAHTMQSFIGGYGQMTHPVGACATAAVSIEEAVDKLRLGKSQFVVAGGIDGISVESLTGFGDMNATADTDAMLAQGIEPRFISRAGDRRRGGFLEAEGGGTILLTTATVAADLGLPVYGVISYAQSFADGAHTSIPAPGMGALAAGRGGSASHLARSLQALGLTPDDIAVVSKHDTSTHANDPNEAELHARLARALGRSDGNPLYVISQKTITGHAKAGAAVFQIGGLCDVFRTGQLPANQALDCVDPVMREHAPLVWLREPLTLREPVRAAMLTSLGFGHVAALVALAHPSAFMAVLAAERGNEAVAQWRNCAQKRLRHGQGRFEAAMTHAATLFTPIAHRRFDQADDAHEVEAALLLDPQARLDSDGVFRQQRA
ncbi:fatty acid synthase subunit beta domain-containing protein [Trueperella sp. LYQ141]|uniref:fatty acid synthase subunit beta domain-containing protein n=1 Tax=Trueperella sp. LYQ141 TaxID=3391058 RepID=UPI0039839AB6